MMRVIQFHVSELISVQNDGNRIDYGLFSPLWLDFMINNEVIDLDYSSTYSELASDEEHQFNQVLQETAIHDIHELPISMPSKTHLKIRYHPHENLSHIMSLRHFAALVGGSFVNTYLPILPVRVLFSKSDKSNTFSYSIPRERLNAEMLSRWLTVLPPSLRKAPVEYSRLNKALLHRRDWYGIRIQSNLNFKTHNNTRRETLFDARITFSLFFKEELIHEDPSKNTTIISETTNLTNTSIFSYFEAALNSQDERHKAVKADHYDHYHSVVANDIVRSSTIDAAQYTVIAPDITRKIMNKGNMIFQLLSTIKLQILQDIPTLPNVIIQEIAPHYQLDINSYQYRFCLDEPCSGEWAHISNLGDIIFLDNNCQYVKNINHWEGHRQHGHKPNDSRCQSAVSILPFVSHQHMMLSTQYLQLRLDARKIFMTSDLLPPDASYGAVIPPLVVGICLDASNNKCQLFTSPSLLMTYPIPDRTMPYNVLTMVGTLFAFILGSMLNLLLKKWRMRAATTDKSAPNPVDDSTRIPNIDNPSSSKESITKDETHEKSL